MTYNVYQGCESVTLKKINQMFYQRKEEKTMTIINIETKEAITINDKNSSYLEGLLQTINWGEYTCTVTVEDVRQYGIEGDEIAEELVGLVYSVKLEEEKATAGTPEATKKPTVGEVMDMEKKYREVIFTDLVQSAVFCDGGQTSEEYEEKRMDAMSAWKNLEAHLSDDSEGHKLYDEYMTKVNVAVSTLLCDVYRKALHDSLTIPETLELCQWFEKTKIDSIFDGLPTI